MSETSTVPEVAPDAPPGNRQIPSWAASLGAHVLILLALGSYKFATTADEPDNLIVAVAEDQQAAPELDYRFDATITDRIGNNGDGSKTAGSQAVAAVVSGNVQQAVQRRIEEEVLVIDSAPVSAIPQVAEGQLSTNIETRGTAERTGGVEGSLDRVTFEIINSLRERPTLVIWLFDESPSMKLRREQITTRFANIYGQLAALDPNQNQHLKTAVVGFGKDVHFYGAEPTNDVEEAKKLVMEMREDDSGIENIFTALGRVVERYKKFRTMTPRHNVMVILTTDERGDDLDQLEKVSASYVASGMKVFAIAHASPFGRQKGYVRWQYKDKNGTFDEDVEIDQGPESIRQEVVDLPFWGATGVDLSRLSSGLGPYHLTRICAETGGLYLITDDHRSGRFDFAVMRNYLPDYRPESVYLQELKKNGAKRALVETAEKTRDFQASNKRVGVPALTFRADNDNAVRTAATNAQRQVVELEYLVNEVVKSLEPGEKDRPKVKEPRWRAAFDLAYGRALALQARAQGYNILMAQMKVAPRPFANKGSNTWNLKPSKDISAGPSVKKLVAKSTEYLSRVVDEHPGTPWADLAERELREPMGWEWQEERKDYEEMERRAQAAANQKQVLFADEDDPKKPGQKKPMMGPRQKPRL